MFLYISTNAGEVAQKFYALGQAFEDITLADLEKAIKFAVKRAVPWNGGGSYRVSPVPGQQYIRTGTLGESTIYTRDGSGVTIYSTANQRGQAYSSYVIGDSDGLGQALIHQGRWPNLREEVINEMVALVETLDQDLQDAIDRTVG